ncbi:hypothetical protein [Caulobacter segnis]|uniref:hypothetical protein n=1 Tax=Caulobacter segnis TaxID=88688 RepID=UPI0026EA76CB|nr:hypothetical protein [Caulobacter segnis]
MTQLFLICPNCRTMVEATKQMQLWTACSFECFAARNPNHTINKARNGKQLRLSDDLAREVYLAGGNCTEIGRRYGITPAQVSAIKTGRWYSRVTGATFAPRRTWKKHSEGAA